MVMFAPDLRPDSSLVAEVRPSPNHGERKGRAVVDMLLLHYTGVPDDKVAISHLCNPGSKVSAHYVVLPDGAVIQLVAEARRAWHAGLGSWGDDTDINSCSIGIELANPGHEHGYPAFPKRQIAATIALCRSIFARHRIPPHRVLAHSDVAPARKQDPGEKFPWHLLAASGIGLWVKPARIAREGPIYTLGETNPAIEETQRLLAQYGYHVPASGYFDAVTRATVTAFQRHFRPQRVDGSIDPSTVATLKALLAARDAWLQESEQSAAGPTAAPREQA
jgi:N-acetylmuramoyl-L-alanine amidase